MFGRIRSSPPSPAECLELERLPSKLLKDDSLSIYESTLAKLKQGSQRNITTAFQDSMDLESNSNVSEDLSKVSGFCSDSGLRACTSNTSCMDVSSNFIQEQNKCKEISIRYLFSKYATTHQKQGAASYSRGSSLNVSGFSSDSDSTGCSRVQF